MTVVDFPAPEPEEVYVWRCDCGCTTHYLRSDNHVECAACGTIHPAEGNWAQIIEEEADIADPGETDYRNRTVVSLDSSEMTLKRVLGRADSEKSAAVIVIQHDGHVSAWSDSFDDDEQKAWLHRRLEDAESIILDTTHRVNQT